MIDLVGHLLVFVVAAVVMVAFPLVLGRFLRPRLPTAEKQAVYECGEQPIGSSFIQFDLRFYTVALLFIIFDVEVAFFFPWATVYGGAMQLADGRLEESARIEISEKLLNQPSGTLAVEDAISSGSATTLGMMGLIDILVFFGVLLVGFAYVWKRGDLNWVRAVAQQPKRAGPPGPRSPAGESA